MIEYELKHALDFTKEEQKKFKDIVISMNEVSENTFDRLMSKNPILLFFPNTTEIEAIGALKIPNESYKTKVFRKSRTDYSATDFNFELGWIVSLKQGKGIGTKITKILTEHKPRIYSTVRTENIGMNKILNSLGFIKTGVEYKSERGDYYNCLYIKKE